MEFTLTQIELDSYVKKAQSMVEYCITEAAKHSPVRRLAEVLAKVFPCHFHTYAGTSDTTVYFKCKSIEEMTPIIKYITLVGGLHQEGEKEQIGLTARWNFGSLKIETAFSGKCKMVQTGEETITRPIMEMKCDDDETTQPDSADGMPF